MDEKEIPPGNVSGNVSLLKLVTHESTIAESNIPAALRHLADEIESVGADRFGGTVVNLVWATFSDERTMVVGYLGKASNVEAEASLLLQRANNAVVDDPEGLDHDAT